MKYSQTNNIVLFQTSCSRRPKGVPKSPGNLVNWPVAKISGQLCEVSTVDPRRYETHFLEVVHG
jgi:hypothetical protein